MGRPGSWGVRPALYGFSGKLGHPGLKFLERWPSFPSWPSFSHDLEFQDPKVRPLSNTA